MLWLVGSLFFTSICWPAITPITCGLYMQPLWSSVIAVVGTCQFLSGSPDFTHTKAYLTVLLPLTTTSSEVSPFGCARVQTGLADMSSFLAVGFVPSKATLPVTVPPFASSAVAAPPAAPDAGALSALGASAFFSSPPPQPASVKAAASPAPIQNF